MGCACAVGALLDGQHVLPLWSTYNGSQALHGRLDAAGGGKDAAGGLDTWCVYSKKQEHASDAALCVTRTCIKKCASCIRVSGKAPRSCCSPWDQPWCTVASLSNVDCCLHCLHALNYRQTASMVVGVPWPIAGALLLDCCLHCLHAHAPTDEALSEHMSLTHQKMAAILARALEKRHFDCNDGDVLLPIKPSRAFHTMVLWFQVRLIVAGGLKDRNVAT
eukprot:1159833-Pelagomonas_calceolata.AAC.1